MANKESLYLCHMTAEEKKAYNAKYYQEHKDYWQEYYKRENVDKRNARQSAAYKFGNNLIRPKVYDYSDRSESGELQILTKPRRSGDSTMADITQLLGYPTGRYKGVTRKQVQNYNKNSTPDLDARTESIQKARTAAQQQAARLSTPDLNARLKAMSSYVQPARASKLSQITSSAISKGKSIVNGLLSMWKSGAK